MQEAKTTTDFAPTPRTRVKRLAECARYDRETVYAILDAGLVCHVGYEIDGQPYVTATAYWREGDRVYWHGSSASRMLRRLKEGVPVCFTVALLDGVVLARSGYNSTLNYRSVMAFGTAEPVTDEAEKLAALEAFSERLTPGRWPELRPATKQELKATLVRGGLRRGRLGRRAAAAPRDRPARGRPAPRTRYLGTRLPGRHRDRPVPGCRGGVRPADRRRGGRAGGRRRAARSETDPARGLPADPKDPGEAPGLPGLL
jgi:nitroimidazol reductase NimA-like FMN-containing flavoprotein (pyridoxamine 5'-phosphate oxidase superfamily)